VRVLGKAAFAANASGAMAQEKVYISSNGSFSRLASLAAKLFKFIH